jgi:RNA polymerase-interacting CarD/CdnL/TRCF family regulator
MFQVGDPIAYPLPGVGFIQEKLILGENKYLFLVY